MNIARRAFVLVPVLLFAGCAEGNSTTASTGADSTTSTPASTSADRITTETAAEQSVATAAFLLGGEFAENQYQPLFLNVLECPPGNHTQPFGLGSTTFEVQGIQGEQCFFGHGTEIESPDWDGAITHACAIDTQQTIELTVTDEGMNLETFETFCVEI